jgi:hypothetical protein
MQTNLFCAALVLLMVGTIHSILGEWLIFRHLRTGGMVPAAAAPPLRERHVRILWASWHIVSVLGWAFAAVLLRMAFPSEPQILQVFVQNAIVISLALSALLVLAGTRGRHPGWIGLLAAAVLVAVGG